MGCKETEDGTGTVVPLDALTAVISTISQSISSSQIVCLSVWLKHLYTVICHKLIRGT